MKKFLAINKNEIKIGTVDIIDQDLLSTSINLHSSGYARIGSEKMHRIIMSRIINGNISKELVVDHINRNRLDNRRCNLRLATKQENSINVGKHRGSSRFMGVSWKASRKKWCAQIKLNGKVKHLGLFEKEEDAAIMYNKHAIKLHKEFAVLNLV